MKLGWVIAIACALAVHAGILLFGGIFFRHARASESTTEQVELLSESEQDKPKPEPEREQDSQREALETETEAAPDAAEVIRNLEVAPSIDGPALEAASLSAIEQALSGAGGGGGDFASALTLSSGGRIGASGTGSELDEKLEQAFSLAEIDQKPRATFQAAPVYPSALRGKKVEGVVTLIFVVDAAGKVLDPRVEQASNPAFERPALEAVKQWRFEPAVKGGQRVGCKMRVPIRFQPS